MYLGGQARTSESTGEYADDSKKDIERGDPHWNAFQASRLIADASHASGSSGTMLGDHRQDHSQLLVPNYATMAAASGICKKRVMRCRSQRCCEMSFARGPAMCRFPVSDVFLAISSFSLSLLATLWPLKESASRTVEQVSYSQSICMLRILML